MKTSNTPVVRLLRSGDEYFSLLEQLITQAQQSIYLQYYIFEEDETGKRIAQALITAARNNIKVSLLLDRYASRGLTDSFIQELKYAGVQFKWFNSFLKNKRFYLGRRLHHKVVVADGLRSLVGGLNVSNRYNDTAEGIAWLDWAIYIEGDASRILENICQSRLNRFSLSRKRFSKIKSDKKTVSPSDSITICVNDWVNRKSEITRSYLKMIADSKNKIIIMSPYFLPGAEFRRSMHKAVKRGVTVQLVLAGMSDIPLAKYAERYLYNWLLSIGVQIFEYDKSVLHGKIACCDNNWVTVGSYNINNLSAYASIELNVVVNDPSFGKETMMVLQELIETDCKKITQTIITKEWNLMDRIFHAGAYYVSRLLLKAFTFKSRQRS